MGEETAVDGKGDVPRILLEASFREKEEGRAAG